MVCEPPSGLLVEWLFLSSVKISHDFYAPIGGRTVFSTSPITASELFLSYNSSSAEVCHIYLAGL